MGGNYGISGTLNASPAVVLLTISFIAIAWYNCVELQAMIWMTFKKRRGLYFYSLLFASWGTIIAVLGIFLKFFNICTDEMVNVAVTMIGWMPMITGQSLVLYSRLHLIVRDTRKLRWILWMIIVNFWLFEATTTIFLFMANAPATEAKMAPFYNVWEKVQMTGITLQEFIISGVYLYETRQLLRTGSNFRQERIKRVMENLIYINTLIVVLDAILLGIEYASFFAIETAFKGLTYSIKLKLEFTVLNQLVAICQGSLRTNPSSLHARNQRSLPSFVTAHPPEIRELGVKHASPTIAVTPVLSVDDSSKGDHSP